MTVQQHHGYIRDLTNEAARVLRLVTEHDELECIHMG